MKLRDKVVLVTGASRGIGAEIARQAAHHGAKCALLARTQGDLDRLRDEIGGGCAAAVADVADRAQVDAAVKKLTEEVGAIDVAVVNAGVGLHGPFIDADVADLDRVMRINYLGSIHVLKAVLPGMIERRRGHVAVIGSISGRMGSPFEAGYSASKFALTGLTEALSIELSAFNIHVTLVSPGPTTTNFFEASGHPYDREHPKPQSASHVAGLTIRAIERNRRDIFASAFMRQALISKTLIPPAFRWGSERAFAKELAEMRAR
jgi:short-subunit dehydrogenase